MRLAALLLLLLFVTPASSISQNDYVILTTFLTSPAVDLDHVGRASTQLERAFRFQSGYTERDFLTLSTANTYMDVNVWDSAAYAAAGIAATATNSAVLAFNQLTTSRTNVTFTVSRAFTTTTPSAGTFSRLYGFSLTGGSPDDSFISATTSLNTLYSQQTGFLELVLMKATSGQSWAMFSKWTTASALSAALTATTSATASTAFWQRINTTTLTQTDLSLARTFRTPTLGTPSTQVMFDSFYLNEGENSTAFLVNLADAESALQGEVGYLGRNLEWGRDGRFSIQWWWISRADLDSSLSRISSYTFASAMNSSTLVRRFFVTKASFQPWNWAKTVACGAPIQTRQYSLATGVTEADFLNRIQTAEDIYRAQGLVEWNILQDYDSPWLYMDIGYQWKNYTVAYNAAAYLATNPTTSPVVLAVNSSNATTATYYYMKGFWLWTDTTYSCAKRFEVDPAVTGVTWFDATLRRGTPMHEVVYPPPGITPNGKLLVFLADYGRIPAEYLQFLNQAAGLGYLAVGLAWLNGIEVRRLCVGNSACFKGSWDALLFGATGTSPPLVLDVAVGDSITYRLLVLLQYLNTTASWTGASQFFTSVGLRYDQIAWVGAGAGASAAFSLAQSKLLDRAVAYDGPIDETLTGNQWLAGASVTPKDRWLAVASQLSGRCQGTQVNAAKANVTVNNEACFTQSQGGTQDTAVMQSWQTFYTMAEVWQYTLSQCSTSGLTTAQYFNLTKGLQYSCDGTGEPYSYASKPAVFLSGVCLSCNQTTFRTLSVSPFGYDRGQCTTISPCRTIQYAVSTATAGSRIKIQRGVYTENVIIPVDKANLTIIGELDQDGLPQSILQCTSRVNSNYCLQVYAPRATITQMAFRHTLSLPSVQEVGVMFMSTAADGVVQQSNFSRSGVLDMNAPSGSRAVAVSGAADVGIFDNQIHGTFQFGISIEGPRASALRNLVWGEKSLMAAGILVVAAGPSSILSGNRIRGATGTPGDGIQIQSDSNLVQKNKVWRNGGVAIRICGAGASCLSWSGTCVQSNVVQQNRLGWNQGGWIGDYGCGTNLTCHSFQSVFAPASCTPMLMYVNSASGNDATCVYNSATQKCQTIGGAIARSQARYWVILEDSQYTEAFTLGKEGLVLRSNQLGSYPVIAAPLSLAGPIITINASNVSLESVNVQNTNAAPTVQEIGVYIATSASNTNVEDCLFSRTATVEPTSPGSRGVVVEGPNTFVLESTFSGAYQVQLTVTAASAFVWLNTIQQAGQTAIMLMQQPPPATTNGTVVKENTILSAGLDGIQIQGGFSLIEFNTVENAQRVGIHLCSSSNKVGPGGACQWPSALNTVETPQGNVVKENVAIRSAVNFIDDLNSTANDFTKQMPRYEPVGITDPSDVLTTDWVAVSPTSTVVGGVVPLRILGYWERGYTLQVKLAAGQDDCYGYAPVSAGGITTAAVDIIRNVGTVGPISVAGEYLACIKHRQDWEPTETVVTVGALDSVSVYGGAPSCLAALQANSQAYCGCWFRRGSPADTYFLSTDLPLSLMSTGEEDIAINQGCCVRNTPTRTGPNYVDSTTSWGLCSDSA